MTWLLIAYVFTILYSYFTHRFYLKHRGWDADETDVFIILIPGVNAVVGTLEMIELIPSPSKGWFNKFFNL